MIDSHPRRKQLFSRNIVERKRLDRTLPAIINGISASEARSHGLIEDASDLDEWATSHYEPLFVTEGSDEESEKSPISSGDKVTKALKPSPSNATLTSTTTPDWGPTVSFDNFDTHPFTSLKPTSVDQSPTSKDRPDRESPFPPTSSFGKPSFLPINGPVLSPITAPSGPIFEQQSKVQDSSSAKHTNLVSEKATLETGNPPSSGDATAPFESIALPRNTAGSTFGDTTSFPNGVQGLGWTEKAANSGMEKSTDASPATRSRGSAENWPQQPDRLFPQIPFTTKPDERDLFPTPPNLQSGQRSPKTTKEPLTGATSLPLPDFSPLPMSLQSDPTLSAAKTNTTNPFNIASHQVSSTSATTSPSLPSTANIGAHIVGKAGTNPQSFLFTDPSNSSNITPPLENYYAVQTDLGAGSRTRTINSSQKPTVLNALSVGIMHGDDGLLQQFIDYMVGPIVAKSIHEMKDERSWTKASQSPFVLVLCDVSC